MFFAQTFLRLLVATLAVFLGTITVTAQSPKGSKKGPPADGNVYQRTIRSVVWVFDPVGGGQARTGSGTLIDTKDRLVVTNYHVVRDHAEVSCVFPSFDNAGKPITERDTYLSQLRSGAAPKGKVLAKIPAKDLALIQLDRIPKDIPAVRLAKDGVGQGDTIHCIGNAGASGGLWNYTKGDVRNVAISKARTGSGKSKTDEKGKGDEDSFVIHARMIEHSALVNRGDSGGPVLNDSAELVGVTQGHVPDEVARGISLAVDLSEVKDFLKGNKYARLTVYQPTTLAVADKSKTTTTSDAEPTEEKSEAEKQKAEADRQEKAAQSRLEFARDFIIAGKKDRAREWLEKVIKDYPKTNAAAEAKKLLEEINK